MSLIKNTTYIEFNDVTEEDFQIVKIVELRRNDDGYEKNSVKINFHDINIKQLVLKEKLKLKDLGSGRPLPKVFINNDDPLLTHKENTRLRSKAYNLRKENPASNVLIKKGSLYHNTVQIDKFDLSNQIF